MTLMKLSARAFLLASATAAFAGAAQAQTASSRAADASTQLEEIVVTAQRRAENLQDVPIAVAAVTADTAEKLGVGDIATLTSIVPGFTFNRQSAGSQPFIRGVGNPSTTIGNEPSVAIFVDDQYIPTANAAMFEFNNIDLLEVLKGPQGTLFGRNATGGVVHIHTRNPTFEPKADFNAGYGNYDTMKLQGYGSLGLTDNIAANLAAFYLNQEDGWGVNVTNGSKAYIVESWGVRGKILAQPDDTLSILLSGSFNDRRSNQGQASRTVMGFAGRNGLTPEQMGAGFYDITSANRDYYISKFTSFTAKVDKDFGGARLVSITGYANSELFTSLDTSVSTNNFFVANYQQNGKSWTQELQLLSPSDAAVQWIIGGFYLRDRAVYDAVYTGVALGTNRQAAKGVQTTNSLSGFAQATAEILPRTNLTLGLRYTSDRRKLTDAGGNLGPLNTSLPRTVVAGPFRDQQTFSNLSGRFALDHKFSDDIMGYVAYNRGYKSGVYAISAYNAASTGAIPPVLPEELNAYSFGFKSEFADRRIRLNAEAFYYNYTNIQVQNNRPDGSGVIIVNGGKATMKGFEFELTVVPTSGLTVTASASVVDGKYNKFALGPKFFPLAPNPQIPIPAGCTKYGITTYPPGAGTLAQRGCDLDGNDTLQTPPFVGNLAAIYTLPTDFGTFDLAASWTHSASYFFEPDNLYWTKQPSTDIVNASIKLTLPSKRFDVRLWANNLTKQEYYTYIANSAQSGPKGSAAAPRTYGVTVGAHF